MRRQIHAAVGDGRNHGDQLQRRDGDFLADGDGADRRGLPTADRPQQAARFAGQLDIGTRAEAEVANIFVELVGADLQRQLDGGHVA